jgi:hypothetical protein
VGFDGLSLVIVWLCVLAVDFTKGVYLHVALYARMRLLGCAYLLICGDWSVPPNLWHLVHFDDIVRFPKRQWLSPQVLFYDK